MYCEKCGKQISEQEKFCSFCGAKIEKPETRNVLTAELIQKAQNGEKAAFDTIYNATYKDVCIITRSFFPEDSSEREDCVQDIYLNLYEKLSFFDSAKGEFLPWLKRVAQNICVNHYNKKKKLNARNESLDAVTETEDSKQEKQFEDERLEFNPEAVMDQNETSRLLQEILDELPLEQKQCLLLYYAAQYKQEVIAEMLGIPKGTVKSRLYNGKKLVEEKVLALEKRGTKLYSMSPIAFFIWLFTKESEVQAANAAFAGISALHAATEGIGAAAVESSATVAESAVTSAEAQAAAVAENAATSAAVKGAVGAGAKAAATKVMATKVIAGIVGAVVIGTGGYFAYDYYQNNKVKEAASNGSEASVDAGAEVPMEEKEETHALKEIVNQNLVTYVLKNLTGTEILQRDVEIIVSKIAALQRSYLTDGIELPDTYYIPEEYVVGTDREDLATDMPVGIVYKKEGFQELFDLLGAEYSWDELSVQAMVSYQDDENIGFLGMGLGGSSEINVQINSMVENDESLKIYYEKSVQLIGMEPTINRYICTIVPEDNSIGYRIDSIEEDVQADMAAEYADLITAYSKYFYDGEETPDLLTEEIITGRQYGIGKADTEQDTKLYYGIVDSNNDGAYECIFTSEPSEDPEKIYLYDFWMKKDGRFLNVLSGFNPEYMAFFDDGMIKTFRSNGENTGIYDSMRVDQERGLREMRVLYEYDEEHPYDEDEFNEKVNMTAAVDKNIQWTLIEPES